MTDNEAYRKATFSAATKGLTAWQTAKAVNLLRPGLDWRGCTKTYIRDQFISGDLSHFTGQDLRNAVTRSRTNAS